MAAIVPMDECMRGPTLRGSGVPPPQKRSRSISNVSLRILALLFCCEQLILNMRRTSRVALGFQSDGEHDHVHWDPSHEVIQRVFGSDNDFPSSDGWMDGPVRHLDYTSANKMNTTRFSSIVALRYCHSAR